MKILTLIIVISLGLELSAQTIIIKQTVPESLEDDDDDFGPARKIFNHPYIGFGFATPSYSYDDNTEAKTNVFKSFSLYSGTRSYKNYNKIITRVFDYEIAYSQYSLNIKEDSLQNTPLTAADAKNAKYWFVKIGGALALQFNLKPKRGNQLGKYILLGGYGNWLPIKRMGVTYDISPSAYASKTRVSLGKLKYMNAFDYGAVVRFGATNYAFFAKYRFSDYFKNNIETTDYFELPRLTVGVHLFPGNL